MSRLRVQQLAEEIADEPFPSAEHQVAMELAIEQWSDDIACDSDSGRLILTNRVRAAYKQSLRDEGYGFIAAFVLVTIAAAAISWAIERFLTWLFPEKQFCRNRAVRLAIIRG